VVETEVEMKGTTVNVGKTHILFTSKVQTFSYQGNAYDVSPDGQNFIINSRPDPHSQEITVIANWTAGIKN
jgi:hypothetical protein